MKKWISIFMVLLCLTGCASTGKPAVTDPTPSEDVSTGDQGSFSL